jgi:hypothetical protein
MQFPMIRTACARRLLPLLLLLTLPAVVQGGDYTYTTNNGTITITRYMGPGGAVIIPSAINGYPVTSIGSTMFFSSHSSPSSVTIPNSVTGIEPFAFLGCESLTNITIPNSVTIIGSHAFAHCTGLTNVTIPKSVTNIGAAAFISCSRLTSVTIPSSVTSIGNSAFSGCGSLTGAYFEGNAPSIGWWVDKATFYQESITTGKDVLWDARQATVYYLPGTTGWGQTFGTRPTKPWKR